jgi:hypothetical protein
MVPKIMNETPSNYTPEQVCLFYIIGLRYALAGDLESIEHVDFLERRWRSIRWDDPEFIRFTEEMRANVPKLTPEQEEPLEAPLQALLHAMTERIASHNETDTINAVAIRKMIEQMHQCIAAGEQSNANFDRLAIYAKELTEMAFKMRDRLEMLHDDVSVFKFPEI